MVAGVAGVRGYPVVKPVVGVCASALGPVRTHPRILAGKDVALITMSPRSVL